MTPEEIESREFFVGLRGFDKDEVHQFLAEVAEEQRTLLARLELAALEGEGLPTGPRDDFEDLGASVAAILRTAKESAASMQVDAEQSASTLRADAEHYSDERRRSADEYAASARSEADALFAVAAQAAEDARAEAERRLADADERIRMMEAEAVQRARSAAESVVADASTRVADITRRSDAMRARLQEANDEIQLALLALGDSVDPQEIVRAALGADIATSDGHVSTNGHLQHEDR
jgi:DivIVA domain-containing protein